MAGWRAVLTLSSSPNRRLVPETVADYLRAAYANGKAHAIVVVAEGARIMRREWRNFSIGTMNGLDLTCGSPSWVMCSVELLPVLTIACWGPCLAQRRLNSYLTALQGC